MSGLMRQPRWVDGSDDAEEVTWFADHGPFVVDGITYRRPLRSVRGPGVGAVRLMLDVIADHHDNDCEWCER